MLGQVKGATPQSGRTRGSSAEIFTGLLLCLSLIGCGKPDDASVSSPAQEQAQNLLSQAETSSPDPAPTPSESLSGSKLPTYELKIATSALRALEMNPFANATYPATFTAGGKQYEGVKV